MKPSQCTRTAAAARQSGVAALTVRTLLHPLAGSDHIMLQVLKSAPGENGIKSAAQDGKRKVQSQRWCVWENGMAAWSSGNSREQERVVKQMRLQKVQRHRCVCTGASQRAGVQQWGR